MLEAPRLRDHNFFCKVFGERVPCSSDKLLQFSQNLCLPLYELYFIFLVFSLYC
jgi:hypothetical protein